MNEVVEVSSDDDIKGSEYGSKNFRELKQKINDYFYHKIKKVKERKKLLSSSPLMG